jgi:hypothetical protein
LHFAFCIQYFALLETVRVASQSDPRGAEDEMDRRRFSAMQNEGWKAAQPLLARAH